MFNPKVSIIIPVYNGSNYLAEAIDSALNQTYKNIEILVINDGSNDNLKTEKVALSFGDKIRYINKKNGGVSTALNLGIEKMTGEYFSWLSHDDLYFKNKIEEQINFLNNMDDKNIILSSNYVLVDEKGKETKEIKVHYTSKNILYKLLIKSFLNGCALLIPRTAFDEIGVFEDKLKTTQDYHLWFRMMKKYKFHNVGKKLVKSRQHDLQDSKTKALIAIREIKKLHHFILNYFSLEEIYKSSGSHLPKSLFYFQLKYKLMKPIFLANLVIGIRKLGFYNLLAPLYRKYFIK